jgi:hypothetical protein
VPAGSGVETILLKMESVQGVKAKPPEVTSFTLAQASYITRVWTYHYDSVIGTSTPTVAFKNTKTGALIGPWSQAGYRNYSVEAGSAASDPRNVVGPPDNYWVAYPGVVVPAGTYQVIDSAPESWAYTSDLGNRGVAWVYGWAGSGPASKSDASVDSPIGRIDGGAIDGSRAEVARGIDGADVGARDSAGGTGEVRIIDGGDALADRASGWTEGGSDVPAGTLTIVDYFPKSGPAGTHVRLRLAASVMHLAGAMSALYGARALDGVAGVGADVVEVVVPSDAQSADIQLKAGAETSNKVAFTILAPVSTVLVSQTVAPSTSNVVVAYKDEITVTIPPGILDKSRTLTITKVENAPSNSIAPFAPSFAYDVSIDGLEQLADYVEIKVKVDPSLLNTAVPASAQLLPLRWNAAEGHWLPLAYRVDTTGNSLSFYTNHFTLFEWVVIGAVAVAAVPITWVGEKLLNDVYVTPEGSFRVLYCKKAIQGDLSLEDTAWTKTTYPNPANPLPTAYAPDHPKFVQDIGHLLEVALDRYVRVSHLKNPVSAPEVFGAASKNPITVKLDSWWVSLGGEPNYEKIWEYLHYPTDVLNSFVGKSAFSYGNLSHELFHRIEAEYYGWTGFLSSANKWWLEASADYAGYNLAWTPAMPTEMHERTGYDFFAHPLSTTGKMENVNGWNLNQSYEYAASAFVQYLVEGKKLVFKELIEQVAKGSPLQQIDGYQQLVLSSVYRDFAADGVFATTSFLSRFPAATIASYKTTMGSNPQESVTMSLDGGYTAKLWDIQVPGSTFDSTSSKASFTVSADASVPEKLAFDVFVLKGDVRAANVPELAGSIDGAVKSVTVQVEKGDAIYVLGTNWDGAPHAVSLKISKGGASSVRIAVSVSASFSYNGAAPEVGYQGWEALCSCMPDGSCTSDGTTKVTLKLSADAFKVESFTIKRYDGQYTLDIAGKDVPWLSSGGGARTFLVSGADACAALTKLAQTNDTPGKGTDLLSYTCDTTSFVNIRFTP